MSKKIIHVIAYYPPSLGGMEKVAEHLASEQSHQGNDVEVVTSIVGYDDSYADSLPHVTRLWAKKIFNLPIIPGLLLHLLREPSNSIFHCHVAQAFIPDIALLVARLRRSKLIIHYHIDAKPSGKFGFIFSLYKKTLYPFTMRHADAVIVFSNDHYKNVISAYDVNPRRVVIIPNGVGQEFYASPRKSPGNPIELLFIGRLEDQKNVPLLLESIAKLDQNKFHMTIVGSGELDKELQDLSRSLNLKNVDFVGRKSGEELLEIYRHADIFTLSSKREGMPLVLLEAMAMGLPIVATDVEGTRDVVTHNTNGLLAPLGNSKAFADMISRCADPAIYRQLSEASYQKATRMSWKQIAEQCMELYENI